MLRAALRVVELASLTRFAQTVLTLTIECAFHIRLQLTEQLSYIVCEVAPRQAQLLSGNTARRACGTCPRESAPRQGPQARAQLVDWLRLFG